MTYAAELEHSYGRWLRLYPKQFRREHGREILGVLLAAAGEGQRQPRLIECLDLMRSAMWMRLRPSVPRSERSVFATIKLMLVGAAVELAVGITVLVTANQVQSQVASHNPGFNAAQGHAAVMSKLDPLVMAAAIAVLFWLCMAWAHGRGHRWTPIALAVFFATNTSSLVQGLANGSAVYARADLVVGGTLWLLEAAVLVILCHNELRKMSLNRWSGRRVSPLR